MKASHYQPEQPLTQMEGYTNLSLIKEEDFNRHGVGHFQGPNTSKRIYGASNASKRNQNQQTAPFHDGQKVNTKGRKASEATTVQNEAGIGGSRKQNHSVDNRYQTPLRLPNLRTPGSKKNSNGGGQTLKSNMNSL